MQQNCNHFQHDQIKLLVNSKKFLFKILFLIFSTYVGSKTKLFLPKINAPKYPHQSTFELRAWLNCIIKNL